MKTSEAATAMGALSHETRLELYRLLVRRGPQGWPAGVLAQKVGVAPPILTFHAQALEHAGLVESHAEGRLNIYTANFKTMGALVEFLGAECCSQADAGCATDCVPAAAIRKRRHV
jgi:ArsR family transcriptional regulator, arsenate/arsenite/antimonite-responsive transcriptional repressor